MELTLTRESACQLPMSKLAELWVRYQGIVRTFNSLRSAGEWILLKMELAEAALQYSLMSSVREEIKEPDLPNERKKIRKQVSRLRAARTLQACSQEVSLIEAEVRQHLENETDLRNLYKLQQRIDGVVQRYPRLYEGKEMNREINKAVDRI